MTSRYKEFYEQLRGAIWPRTTSEDQSPPSWTSLQLHRRRCCWVLHVWREAVHSWQELPLLEHRGWKVQDGEVSVVLETQDSIRGIEFLLHSHLRGCSCMPLHCTSSRCSSKRGQACSRVCRCSGCLNIRITPDAVQLQEQTEEEAENHANINDDDRGTLKWT